MPTDPSFAGFPGSTNEPKADKAPAAAKAEGGKNADYASPPAEEADHEEADKAPAKGRRR